MRVAIWANGISCKRLAAVRIATSPVPPCPEWQAFTINGADIAGRKSSVQALTALDHGNYSRIVWPRLKAGLGDHRVG